MPDAGLRFVIFQIYTQKSTDCQGNSPELVQLNYKSDKGQSITKMPVCIATHIFWPTREQRKQEAIE